LYIFIVRRSPPRAERKNGRSLSNLCKNIFANRMKHRLSQQELATRAHVGLKTITRAEGGFDNLSTETYDKIFLALGLDIKDLAEAMIQLQSGKDELAVT